jgi:polynucleotide 5'-kinase involved in rRNA processing
MTKEWPKDLGRLRNVIAGSEKGVMIALLDQDQNMLDIARLEEFDFLNNNMRIRSNYKGDIERIKGIQFGSLRLTENGEEAGFVEPGAF